MIRPNFKLDFARRRNALLIVGTFLILVFITIAYLSPPDALQKLGLFGQKKQEQVSMAQEEEIKESEMLGLAEVTGILEVLHADDFENDKATYTYLLKTDSGKTIKLKLDQSNEARNAGAKVRVKGKKIRVNKDENVLISPDALTPTQDAQQAVGQASDLNAVPLTDSAVALEGSSVEVLSPANDVAAPTRKKVVVAMFNFTNDRSQPFTADQVRSAYFGSSQSMANLYGEASQGDVEVTGDVFGWFESSVASNSGFCSNPLTASEEVKLKLADSGVDIADYQYISYVIPSNPACNWAGIAFVNTGSPTGRFTGSWINGTLSTYVISHELGHNFRSAHASTHECFKSGIRVPLSVSSDCTTSEYGDLFSVMSANNTHLPNGLQIHQMNIQPAAREVTSSGTYTVTPLYSRGTTPLLKIKRGTGEFFYLDYRQFYDTYDSLASFHFATNITEGVGVRLSDDETTTGRTKLLDNTPGTSFFTDPALTPGNIFTDPFTGMTIKTLSVSADGATVEINIGVPDTTPPSAVSGLTVTASGTSIISNWGAATDNTQILGYNSYLNGVKYLGNWPGLSWTYDNLQPETTYTIDVEPVDIFFNVGPKTSQTVKTGTTATPSPTPSPTASPNPNDTTPPTVSLTQPTTEAIIPVGKTITLKADASDNVKVAKVEFYTNGARKCSDTSTPYTCNFKVPTASGVSYKIQGKAFDRAGNTVTSEINVTSGLDTKAPSVALNSPGTITHNSIVVLSATASDEVGVSKVEFYVNGTRKCSDTSAPYTCNWSVPAATGTSYTLVAKAYDSAGNFGISTVTLISQ